jgi:nitrite reductase/ring-hydroxylating ferredoxin subunit
MTNPDSNVATIQVDLGLLDSFDQLPAPITVDGESYFLAKGKDGMYRLLSAICPHSWGTILKWDTCFMCPDHGWRFEMTEGICINGPRAQMYAFPVTLRQGHLFAEVPES